MSGTVIFSFSYHVLGVADLLHTGPCCKGLVADYQMDENRRDGRTDGWMDKTGEWLDRVWKDGWMEGRIYGWMDEWNG